MSIFACVSSISRCSRLSSCVCSRDRHSELAPRSFLMNRSCTPVAPFFSFSSSLYPSISRAFSAMYATCASFSSTSCVRSAFTLAVTSRSLANAASRASSRRRSSSSISSSVVHVPSASISLMRSPTSDISRARVVCACARLSLTSGFSWRLLRSRLVVARSSLATRRSSAWFAM